MNRYQYQSIENQSIKIEGKDIFFLGPGLEMHNCKIEILVSGRNLVITDAAFVNCQISLSQKTANFDWFSARLIGCKFLGTIVGQDFGKSDDEDYPNGLVEACDFSASRMDGCRFYNFDIQNTKLPLWPSFTITKPLTRTQEMKASGGTILKKLGRTYEFAEANPDAICELADSLSVSAGISLQEIRSELEGKDWVIIL